MRYDRHGRPAPTKRQGYIDEEAALNAYFVIVCAIMTLIWFMV